MIISEGHYRCAHCQIYLLQEHHKICVSVNYINNALAPQFADYIRAKFIKDALLIPDNPDREVHIHIFNNDEFVGFQWIFDERVLANNSSLWGLTHFICSVLDKIGDEIKSHDNHPLGKILFRKDSLISFKIEGDDLIITHAAPEDFYWHHPPHKFEGAAKMFKGPEYKELTENFFLLKDDILDTTLSGNEFDDVIAKKIMSIIEQK